MCGRYHVPSDNPSEILAAYIAEARARADSLGVKLTSCGEARPTDVVPVLAPSARDRTPGAFPMRWGFPHPTHGMLVFNTRSETAAEKSLFVTSIEDRRCLIPATCFYEWQKAEKQRIKYEIAPREQPLYLAGLYFRSSREKLPCFTILTTDAVGEMKRIHSRMPLIIPAERCGDWLSSACAYNDMLRYAVTDVMCKPA